MKLEVKARWIFLLVFISPKVTSRDQIDDLFTRRAKFYDPANNPSLDLDTYKPCYGNTEHCGQCETGFVPCLFYDAFKAWGTADYIGCIKYGERDKCCSKGGGSDGTWFYIDFFVPNGMTCRHLSSQLRPGGGCDKRNYGYCQYRNMDGTTYFKCQDQITEHCQDVKNKPKILQRPYSCVTSEYGCTINGRTCESECKYRGTRDYRGFNIYKCNVPYDVHDSGLHFCSSDSKHTIVEDESCIGLCNKGDKRDEGVPAGVYWCNIGGGDHKWNYCSPDEDTITSELSTPEPVDCKLAGWTDWSSCTVTCGDGTRTRIREILAKESNGGKPCETTEEEACFMEKCLDPVDCSLTGWSSWSDCSVSCGGGRQSKTREVSVPASHGGEPCGKLEQDRHCNTQICPVDCLLTKWSSWTECFGSCGTGMKTRNRHIEIHPSSGGEECDKNQSEEENCAPIKPCPIDCLLSEWSPWTECFGTCGTGLKSRGKHIEVPPSNEGKECDEERSEEERCPLKPCSEITTSQLQPSSDKTESTSKATSPGTHQEGTEKITTNVTVSPGFHQDESNDNNSIVLILIVSAMVLVVILIILLIVVIICLRKKKRKEIVFLDDNPDYNYAESDDVIEMTDENPYYGADDNDSTTDNAILDINDGYGMDDNDSFASTDEEETRFNE